MHTDYIFEKRGGDFVTPLFMRYVDGIAGHIVSIIDPTEEITVVDMSRLVAGVYSFTKRTTLSPVLTK